MPRARNFLVMQAKTQREVMERAARDLKAWGFSYQITTVEQTLAHCEAPVDTYWICLNSLMSSCYTYIRAAAPEKSKPFNGGTYSHISRRFLNRFFKIKQKCN